MKKTVIFGPTFIALMLLPALLVYNNCAPTPGNTKRALQNQGGTDLGSNTGNGSNGGGIGGTPISNDPVAGANYFEKNVLPVFQTNCGTCHAAPRFGGTAPVSILEHTTASALIANGSSAFNNTLINRMQGVDNHPGGNQCFSGIMATPCKEVVDWYNFEFGAGAGGSFGGIATLSNTGFVEGWALDPDNSNAIVNVRIYLDGPAGQGIDLGTIQANGTGLGGFYSGHYFEFQIPSQYANGQNHQLYLYMDELQEADLVPGTPRLFAAYTPTAAGLNFYNQNISGSLASCNGCHDWNYQALYNSLLTPTPAQGGTATNNNFYRYANGLNGHQPGNVCNNIGGCQKIIDWWNTEFN